VAVQDPRKGAQDARIRNLLELEAFLEIQARWKRLGYPFESLTPFVRDGTRRVLATVRARSPN